MRDSGRELWDRARRYCIERASYWHAEYAKLPNDGRADDRYHYSPAALATFPRYNVLEAILPALESIPVAEVDDIEGAMERAALAAESIFTRPPNDDVAVMAMSEERVRFVEQLEVGFPDVSGDPLPWRRTLGQNEAAELWEQLSSRWDIDRYSWPIARDWLPEPPTDALAFDADPFWSPEVANAARSALSSLGCKTVFRLGHEREWPQEVAVDAFEAVYDGSESYWCDATFDWLVFASHESSVVFAGAALPALQAAWPGWKAHRYV